MIDTLYISYKLYDWKKFDTTNLIFIHRGNLEKILNDSGYTNCYSTIEDLAIKVNEIDNLIKSCNRIRLVAFDHNLLHHVDPNNHYLYFAFLQFLNRQKHKLVDDQNLDILPLKLLDTKIDSRKTNDRTLWVGGCSFSFGTGIPSEKRYATLLSNRLQLPLVMMAKGGSSISWQADQWLRSDIRSGDIAIWGLTNISRVDIFKTESYSWESTTIKSYLDLEKKYQHWKIEYFDSLTQSVGQIKNILQVENFFKKIGVDYYLINLMDVTCLPLIFNNHRRFLDLTENFNDKNIQNFLDYAADKEHPGVLQHEKYSRKIYDFIHQKINH
jgi:hypothetical protein